MEIPSKAAKTRGLKGILYFKTVKDGILSYKQYRTVEFTTNSFGVKRCEVTCAKKTKSNSYTYDLFEEVP